MGSDDLLVGGLLLSCGVFLTPWSTVGFALSFHLLEERDYLPHVVGFVAELNNPDHPRNLLGWLLTRNRYSDGSHPNHLIAGTENAILFAIGNVFAGVVNLPLHNPYYAPGLFVRLFAIAFFVGDALWLRWLHRFVSANSPRSSDQAEGSLQPRSSGTSGQVEDHRGWLGDSTAIWSEPTENPTDLR